jgi:hypothetical protein
MTDPKIGIWWRQTHRERLLFGDRKDDVANRFENVGNRERDGVEIDQTVPAPSQLDDVTRHRAQAECGAVDQAQLPFLHRIDGTAAAPLKSLRQKQDGGEGRPEVMSHLNHQLEPIRTAQAIAEAL